MDGFVSRVFGPVLIAKLHYDDHSLCIQIIREEDGVHLCTPSVNLRRYTHHLGRNEFFPQTFPEDEEIDIELMKEGLASGCFQDTGVRITTPHGPVSIWRCTK